MEDTYRLRVHCIYVLHNNTCVIIVCYHFRVLERYAYVVNITAEPNV